MATAKTSKSAAVHAKLGHPVIDSDGHTVEFEPAVMEYLAKVGGSRMVEHYKTHWSAGMNAGLGALFGSSRLSPEQRVAQRATRSPWWGLPTKNTLDRATSTLPKLLHERLDEIGLDVTVLYPSLGLAAPHIDDEEVRKAACRAFNMFHADIFREYADRMIPVAVIPMHTPQEATEELEFAVKQLGFKAVMLAGHVIRPIPEVVRTAPDAARYAYWLDNLCLDSDHDYDPVWAKCVELGVSPTFHSAGMGWGSRTSPSTYMYNHIGHFAAAGEALCKAMFFGGVTRRFPTLRFAFLECGVGWAASLYADMIGHWEKRNGKAMSNYDPANLDRELLLSLYEQYGGDMVKGKIDGITQNGILAGSKEDPATLDDWRRCGIEKREDIRDLFVPSFYFGCEADDPMNASAFNTRINPFGARLNAIFSSDIGHWDVPDMTEVVEEAYELVEHKVMSEEDLRDFMFVNPARLWTEMNSDFFKGTVVESQVRKLSAA
ncbi:MAG: amidohydrolase family protein [Candidatus Binatus sp.]|uniref:amidohydrolase family protein n=1 Tax=Candidatus Binatus sp. TaxID=2811406 RepID=UPI00271FB225|nr:amidohydrolase family protein [Candidatus Binatus sp.]MDO8434287.1 amidohydrolase family protein [Candidatus Binatus sp.]